MSTLPTVSFVIPTLNNESQISDILSSIVEQNYPREKIEILVSDGGSKDQTVKIANQFGCVVLENKKILAEPGVALGMANATGDIVSVVASDNRLIGTEWLNDMIRPFVENADVLIVTPTQKSTDDDHWITKYWLMFSDPFNHLVYWNGCNARTYEKALKVEGEPHGYLVYSFGTGNHPIIALAQGVCIRSMSRTESNEFDDILPLVELIENKQKLMAWACNAEIEHHTIASIKSFYKKQRWAVRNALEKKGYGVNSRRKYLSNIRMIKAYLWPFYSISVVAPLVVSIIMAVVERKKEWIYHMPASFCSGMAFWHEIIKVKVLKYTDEYGRY